MPDDPKRVTEEQANQALQDLLAQNGGNPNVDTEPEVEAAPAEEPAAQAEESAAAPVAEQAPAEGDDVSSLKRRLEDWEKRVEEKERLFESRWKAFHERSTQNQQILRDRYLRKSASADRALRVLKATRTEGGIPEREVDDAIRDIEGSLNPASAQYVPPVQQPIYQPQPQPVMEDQAIVLNDFLNEKGMDSADASKFGDWLRSEANNKMTPGELGVAQQSLDGFLRLAHNRWQQDVNTKPPVARNDAIEAVKTVQRVQREQSKAASSTTAAPRKVGPTAMPAKKSFKDYSKEEIAKLMQMSVEETR